MIKLQIQLSENIWLTNNSHCFELSHKRKGQIKAFKWYTSLESCFKEYLNMRIRNSNTAEFAELVLLHIEAIKEIKKCVKVLQNGRKEVSD